MKISFLNLFHRLADLIDRDSVTLANLETLDNGKPFEDSVFDIQCAIDTLRYEVSNRIRCFN